MEIAQETALMDQNAEGRRDSGYEGNEEFVEVRSRSARAG